MERPHIARALVVLLLLWSSAARGQEAEGAAGAAEEDKTSATVEICAVCACGEIRSAEEASEVVLHVQCSELEREQRVPDLSRVEWPPNPHRLRLSVAFEGLGLTAVESLPANRLVDTLSFSNNAIRSTWPAALAGLPALRRLSFASNQLAELVPDMFSGLGALHELDLSANRLTDFNRLDLAELVGLRRLSLQGNLLRRVPAEALARNDKLEELDLSRNAIDALHFGNAEWSVLKSVRRLNLAGNQIPSVQADTFPENSIELLDLSNNVIASVEESAFSLCTRLRELNLASNQLSTPFALPPSLLSVTLAHNRLQDWPDFPGGITYIDFSYNQLIDLYDQSYADFDNLEILKISGNQLTTFELTIPLPQLFTLDVSYNQLQHVPASISSETLPALGELRLDGNPIRTVHFPAKISLTSLYLNELQHVTSVGDDALSNVGSRSETVEGVADCVHLYLSNCPALVEISDGAFNGTPICLLDISYNNLTTLSPELVDWEALRSGLDLQGNPWDCGCHMQWLLDELLPRIHERYPQYLHELRCSSPRARQGLRMVHWLNWGEKVLCSDGYSSWSSPDQSYVMESGSRENMLRGASALTLALAGGIALALLLAVALSVYLVRSRRRHYRVRAARRRRQADRDRAPPAARDQLTALNRT